MFHMAPVLCKVSPKGILTASYNEVTFGGKPFIPFVLLIFGCEKSMIMIQKVFNGANWGHAG